MIQLDLHNIRHEFVQEKVEEFCLLYNPPFNIITGNSSTNLNLVREILQKYNLTYIYLNQSNLGCITVIERE